MLPATREEPNPAATEANVWAQMQQGASKAAEANVWAQMQRGASQTQAVSARGETADEDSEMYRQNLMLKES